MYCIKCGAKLNENYKPVKILNRVVKHPFTIKIDGTEVIKSEYIKKYVRNDNFSFTTK
jgi:hypothetical protein